MFLQLTFADGTFKYTTGLFLLLDIYPKPHKGQCMNDRLVIECNDLKHNIMQEQTVQTLLLNVSCFFLFFWSIYLFKPGYLYSGHDNPFKCTNDFQSPATLAA